jgi:hypothetical protein
MGGEENILIEHMFPSSAKGTSHNEHLTRTVFWPWARNIRFKWLYAMVEAHDSPQSVHITFVQTALECNCVRFILKLRWMLSKRTVKVTTLIWGECLTHFQFGWLLYMSVEDEMLASNASCVSTVSWHYWFHVSQRQKYTYHYSTMMLNICSCSN